MSTEYTVSGIEQESLDTRSLLDQIVAQDDLISLLYNIHPGRMPILDKILASPRFCYKEEEDNYSLLYLLKIPFE